MFSRLSRRTTGILIAAGALGVALTTALEVVTAPYSPAVSAYALNGAVHLAKVAAVLVLVAGLVAWATDLRHRGDRLTAAVVAVMATAVPIGAVPYSLAEAFLDTGLSPAAADAELTALYERHAWIGITASIALPVVVLAVVTLGVVVLRRRLLPAWAPVASLAAIPVAVLAGVLGESGWAVPHPPAWLFLGLAAYGVPLARAAAPARDLVSA